MCAQTMELITWFLVYRFRSGRRLVGGTHATNSTAQVLHQFLGLQKILETLFVL